MSGCWSDPPALRFSRSTQIPSSSRKHVKPQAGCNGGALAGLANARPIHIVRMIRTIGATTVVVPRNFIATLFIGGSNARSPGFHCFLVASPPVRVLLLFTKHLFVAATVASDGHKTMTGTVVATAMRVPA